MKITDVDALHIRIEDPNIGLFDGSYDDCLIVVRTDEGLTGIGEVESLPAAIQGIVRSRAAHSHARGLRELLIGQDPTDPERLWQLMYDATDYVGPPRADDARDRRHRPGALGHRRTGGRQADLGSARRTPPRAYRGVRDHLSHGPR